MLVLYWYHRQFSEAASERYCQPSLRATLHTGLADFFSGVWAQGRTPVQRDQDYCRSLPSNTTSLIKVIICTSFFLPFSFVLSFTVSLSLYLNSISGSRLHSYPFLCCLFQEVRNRTLIVREIRTQWIDMWRISRTKLGSGTTPEN